MLKRSEDLLCWSDFASFQKEAYEVQSMYRTTKSRDQRRAERDSTQAKSLLSKVGNANTIEEKQYWKYQLKLYRVHLAREKRKMRVMQDVRRTGVVKTREGLHNIHSIIDGENLIDQTIEWCADWIERRGGRYPSKAERRAMRRHLVSLLDERLNRAL